SISCPRASSNTPPAALSRASAARRLRWETLWLASAQTPSPAATRARRYAGGGSRASTAGALHWRRWCSARSASTWAPFSSRCRDSDGRSEERRVGKECRARWSPRHKRKKETARKLVARWEGHGEGTRGQL